MPRRRLAAVIVAAAVLVGACGAPPPESPAPTSAAPAPSPSPTAPGPPAAPTATPSARPSGSSAPSPSAPGISGATRDPCPGRATSARRGRVDIGQSRNWAGYIVGATRGRVTCVEGSWTQPAVRCPSTGQTAVAIWVGIDGSSAVGGIPNSSATLAQTGTAADCTDGRAQDYAWYEFLPDLRHMVPFRLPVSTGDRIWAQVRWTGDGTFTATLINLTQRVGASQEWTLRAAPLLTAEWVVEDPAVKCAGDSCTFFTLARFAPVTITGAATISDRRYPIAALPFPYLRSTIVRSGRKLAVPSALGKGGFTVTWKSS